MLFRDAMRSDKGCRPLCHGIPDIMELQNILINYGAALFILNGTFNAKQIDAKRYLVLNRKHDKFILLFNQA